jgi:hypothetical protein
MKPAMPGGAALIVAAAGLLSACVPSSDIKPVEALSSLSKDETLVVGRVELYPALKPGEQKIGSSYQEFADTALLIVDDELRDVPEFHRGDLGSRIDAPFGGYFFVSHPTEPFYILKGWVVMDAQLEMADTNDAEKLAAPLDGPFKVDLRPGDRAVYIGTIQYFRNEFFATLKVVVKDDYAAANAEFQRKFGKGVTLRKALAVPVTGQD